MVSQNALQMVSQHALQQVLGVCTIPACLATGLQGGLLLGGGAWSRGELVSQHAPRQTPPRERGLLLWTVRIQLESTLVHGSFSFHKQILETDLSQLFFTINRTFPYCEHVYGTDNVDVL